MWRIRTYLVLVYKVRSVPKKSTHEKICFYQKTHIFYPIFTELCQNEYLLLTKFRNDRVKIVGFFYYKHIFLQHTLYSQTILYIFFPVKLRNLR